MIISKYYYVLLLIIIAFQSAKACEPPIQIDGSHRAKLHEQVYIGRVSGIAIPELEKTILPKNSQSYMFRGADKNVRIKVYEVLKGKNKGKSQDILIAKLGWCGSYNINLGDVIAIFGNGKHWEAVNDKAEIAIIRSVLTKQ